MPLFTILLPILRPPAMLPYAVRSILRQSIADWELFIILDGAPGETLAAAEAFATGDPRIRVRAFAKGERNGEAHRHHVLQEASGRYVAQIADDDIWFPRYLAELARLLDVVDFGHLPQCEVLRGGRIDMLHGDLACAADRERMLGDRWNFFGPSCTGYRRDAYDRIPGGWAPAPREIFSDLFMWRKFLALPGITVGTRQAIQVAKLAAEGRGDCSLQDRADETRLIARRLSSVAGRAVFRATILHDVLRPRNGRDWPARRVRLRHAYKLVAGGQTRATLDGSRAMVETGNCEFA